MTSYHERHQRRLRNQRAGRTRPFDFAVSSDVVHVGDILFHAGSTSVSVSQIRQCQVYSTTDRRKANIDLTDYN